MIQKSRNITRLSKSQHYTTDTQRQDSSYPYYQTHIGDHRKRYFAQRQDSSYPYYQTAMKRYRSIIPIPCVFRSECYFLKWQCPNPIDIEFGENDDFSIKLFLDILHLIHKVNRLATRKDVKVTEMADKIVINYLKKK